MLERVFKYQIILMMCNQNTIKRNKIKKQNLWKISLTKKPKRRYQFKKNSSVFWVVNKVIIILKFY